jgi:hypothetical protein
LAVHCFFPITFGGDVAFSQTVCAQMNSTTPWVLWPLCSLHCSRTFQGSSCLRPSAPSYSLPKVFSVCPQGSVQFSPGSTLTSTERGLPGADQSGPHSPPRNSVPLRFYAQHLLLPNTCVFRVLSSFQDNGSPRQCPRALALWEHQEIFEWFQMGGSICCWPPVGRG